MSNTLYQANQSRNVYTRAISAAYRHRVELWDPSTWEGREHELEEKMLRDGDIRGALELRWGMVAGRDYQLVARRPRAANAAMAVAIGTELLDRIDKFPEARKKLARAHFSGARMARIHGAWFPDVMGDGRERSWWFPTHLEDRDKRVYRIVPEEPDLEAGVIRTHWQHWNVARYAWEDETWRDEIDTVRHVYGDDMSSLGYGQGLKDALGWWWWAKTHVFGESLAAVERFAQGILTAKIRGARDAETGLPNEELMRAWQAVLEDMRGNNVLVYDEQDQIELIEMNGTGHQILTEIRSELRNTIYSLILGGNLTMGSGDGAGSYSLANVHENTQAAVIQQDRDALEEVLGRRLLRAVWYHNHANMVELGIENDCPHLSLAEEQSYTPQERITVLEGAARMGLRVGEASTYEQLGIPEPEEGERILTPMELQGGLGGPPAAGGGLFGGLLGSLNQPIERAPVGSGESLEAQGPAPAAPSSAPAAPAASSAQPQDVQDTAMNGAQVTSATELVRAVVDRTLPPESAVEMLVSMFQMPRERAEAIIRPAASFEAPKPPAPPPAAEPAAAAA